MVITDMPLKENKWFQQRKSSTKNVPVPCHYCGNKSVEVNQHESDPEWGPGMGWHWWNVSCPECGCSGPNKDTRVEAIKGWNNMK